MESIAELFAKYNQLLADLEELEKQAALLEEKLKADKNNAEIKAQLAELKAKIKAAKAEADNAKKVHDEAKAREGEGDTQNNDTGDTENTGGENPKADGKLKIVRAKHVLKQKDYFRCGIKLGKEFTEHKVSAEVLKRFEADKNIKVEG